MPRSLADPISSNDVNIAGTLTVLHEAKKAGVMVQVHAVSSRAMVAAVDAGVHLSCNLTGGVFVNQSAAFSDFHASGANPAANASLTDGAYVANRFRIVQSRRHI